VCPIIILPQSIYLRLLPRSLLLFLWVFCSELPLYLCCPLIFHLFVGLNLCWGCVDERGRCVCGVGWVSRWLYEGWHLVDIRWTFSSTFIFLLLQSCDSVTFFSEPGYSSWASWRALLRSVLYIYYIIQLRWTSYCWCSDLSVHARALGLSALSTAFLHVVQFITIILDWPQ
jgi:hypothetical protein